MPDLTPEEMIEIQMVAGIIGDLDYYQLLRVEPSCTQDQIQQGYIRESRRFHPDRFYRLSDAELKDQINRVAKRITEAYMVLRIPEKRAWYDRNLAADRAMGIRYTEQHEEERKRALEEPVTKNPQAKKFWEMAMVELGKSNPEAALRHMQSAMMFDPSNAALKEKVNELKASLRPATNPGDAPKPAGG
ncbi:MAG: Chaperone protein DnaJ [Myxococcota bacterium]|nr:Chaperone protein DnaJ [Myxococcota bacterium]